MGALGPPVVVNVQLGKLREPHTTSPGNAGGKRWRQRGGPSKHTSRFIIGRLNVG